MVVLERKFSTEINMYFKCSVHDTGRKGNPRRARVCFSWLDDLSLVCLPRCGLHEVMILGSNMQIDSLLQSNQQFEETTDFT